MSDYIEADTVIRRAQDCEMNLIIVGALVDLTMYNGWVKKNEFVSIDYKASSEFMQRLSKYGEAGFYFRSKLIDANNQVLDIDIEGKVSSYPTEKCRGSLAFFEHLQIKGITDSENLKCSNVRLVTHASVGRQVIGVDYTNGDFIKKNVPNDGRDQYC